MPAKHIGRRGQQLQFGFRHDSERAFAAREQIDPIHAGRQRISGGVLGGVGQRQLGNIEIDFVAAAHLEHAAVHQRDSQPENVPARAAVAKAARSAGVGGDGSADAGGALGGIGRIELAGARGLGLQRIQRYAWARRWRGPGRFPAAGIFRARPPIRLAARSRRSIRCARPRS